MTSNVIAYPFICIRQHGPYHNTETRQKTDRKEQCKKLTVQKVAVQLIT